MQTPLIINFVPTGMVGQKQDNPHMPISVDEIVSDVMLAYGMGVSIVHLHARGEDGSPSSVPEIYGRLTKEIRQQCPDLVICHTTSGRGGSDFDKRAAVLNLKGDLKPDMASLTLSSLNFIDGPSINSLDTVRRLATRMQERGVKPELEIFDLGMINVAKVLIKEGLIEPPYYFNLILGNIASAQATPKHLEFLVSELPEQSIWGVAGIGRSHMDATALGAVTAPAVRVGLEDNLWWDSARRTPATNAQLIQRVVNIASAAGRDIESPNKLRERLALMPLTPFYSVKNSG